MKHFSENTFDWNCKELVSQYDEFSVWAGPFGRLLLDNVPLTNISEYIDVGCGTGFPLIDITQRIGSNCNSIGIDPWETAIDRCNEKINTIGLDNIKTIKGCFENVDIEYGTIDLITSNLGINNFKNPNHFYKVCMNWLKPSGRLALTTNLTGTFKELYDSIDEILREDEISLNENEYTRHLLHRGTIESITEEIKNSGLNIKKVIRSEFSLRYSTGSAFLRHSVVRSGFMGDWKNFVQESDLLQFFNKLELKLNKKANERGEFTVTVPMAYIECNKENIG